MLKKFAKLYQPYLKMFLAVLISSITISLIDLSIPLLTSNIINDGIGNQDTDIFIRIALFMIVLFVLRVILTYFVTLKGHMVGVSIEFSMRRKLFDKITSLPIKFFDNNSVGRLMARITNDLAEISEVAHHGPEDLAMVVILFFGSSILMINMNVILAITILCLIPLIILINALSRKKFFATNLDLKIKLSDINAQANDTFSGIRQVKAFTNEEHELNKFDFNNNEFYHSKEANYRIMARYLSSVKGFFGLLSLVVIIFGGYLVMLKEMNVGQLTAFIMYVNLFQEPINKFSNFITEYNKAASGFSRYLEIMELDEQEDKEGAYEVKEVIGKIEFKNVWFRYSQDENYILKDFNLIINPQETLALVGESGAGKSTICNLINRYYDIERGEILIDGINIENFKIASLRYHIGLVSQDIFIFSGTLYDNIIYGDLTKTKEDVYKACQAAALEEVIDSLPNGLDSFIGEKGVKLSGGQKQRISLARVFLKNPALMILDEATSALDNKTEKQIQEVISKLANDKTSIVVAHRLSTIENADKIVVLSKDGVEEVGTHFELMAHQKAYYNLQKAAIKI